MPETLILALSHQSNNLHGGAVMQVGLNEDYKKLNREKAPVEPKPIQQTQSEQTRDLIITYLLMGLKPSAIAKSMGLARQYIYRYTKDSKILSYILSGQLSAKQITRVLNIEEKDVLDVMQKYEYYIANYRETFARK